MALVNIPRSNTDKFYRYKMPVMQIKIEGKGNGIRTVVINMEKVMKALERPMEYGAKFIGFELGSQSKCDMVQHSCMFAGKHDINKLSEVLDKFIIMYVLCIKCGNPETIMKVKKNNVVSKCKACGKVFKLDPNHKLSNFIIKSDVNKQVKEKEVKVTTSVNVDDEWTYDTSERAVMLRKQDLFGIEHVYPEEKLMEYLKTNPSPSKTNVELNRLKMSQDWSDNTLIKYLFRCLFINSLFMEDIRTNFYKKVEYLKPLVTDEKKMMLVINCIEMVIEEKRLYDDVVHIFNGFYESELLEEDVIMKWYGGKSKAVDEEVGYKIKHCAKPFIDWLENAEYENEKNSDEVVDMLTDVLADIDWLEQDTPYDILDNLYEEEIAI